MIAHLVLSDSRYSTSKTLFYAELLAVYVDTKLLYYNACLLLLLVTITISYYLLLV